MTELNVHDDFIERASYVKLFLHSDFNRTQDDISFYKQDSKINSTRRFCGQVGVRCRHCASLPINSRHKSHLAFPTKLSTIHKCMSKNLRSHFAESCPSIHLEISDELARLKKLRKLSAGSTSQWVQWAKDLGVVQSNSGLRFENSFENKNRREISSVVVRPTPDYSVRYSGSKIELSDRSSLESRGPYYLKQSAKENLEPGKCSANDDFAIKNLQKQTVDKKSFIGVANEIYETLSTPQKSLLLGQFSDGDERTYSHNASPFSKWLETAVLDDLDDLEDLDSTKLDADTLDDLDDGTIKSSNFTR